MLLKRRIVNNQIGDHSAEFKLACLDRFKLARHLMGRWTKSERRRQITAYGQKHGQGAQNLLENEVMRQWKNRER